MDREKIKGLKEERKWTEERKNNLQTLRSLKLMECTPAGWSTPAAHGLKELYKENKLQIVPHPLNWGSCLCLYHQQRSQNKHLPSGQSTPKV